mmetsp:Transcript_19960/g.20074  ORF Transcript_19960/g.20074 Transcript_19960/m.20074 type:complete len:132 (+) Transcript_19960:186-581(+)
MHRAVQVLTLASTGTPTIRAASAEQTQTVGIRTQAQSLTGTGCEVHSLGLRKIRTTRTATVTQSTMSRPEATGAVARRTGIRIPSRKGTSMNTTQARRPSTREDRSSRAATRAARVPADFHRKQTSTACWV